MTCYHCGARVDNGLALCELCQKKARMIFEYLPVYFRNLARWRPGRAGSRPVPGSRVLYDGTSVGLGTGDRISDALDEASNALVTWARALADARPHIARLLDRLAKAKAEERIDEAQMVAWLCAGFDRFLTSVSTLDWCGEFVRDLDHHEQRLQALTLAAIPGWYAGACRRDGCGVPTYVVPGLTWVTCSGCGVTTYARDHLEFVLDEARDWIARPKLLAETIVALVDTEQSVDRLYTRIRQWAFVGDLQPIMRTERAYVWSATEDRVVLGTQEVGFARYRFGDVFDLTMAGGTRRASRVHVS